MAAAAQPAPQKPLARLQSNIERLTRSVNAKWAIYSKCLETGEEIAINADDPMDTMSVIKIPLMAEAFRQIEAGKFALTDRVTLTDAAKRGGTGVIRSLDPGVNLTVKDLLTLMIIVSDNTATDLIYDKVGGPPAVNRLMDAWGFKSIRAMTTADAYFKALAASDRNDIRARRQAPVRPDLGARHGKAARKDQAGRGGESESQRDDVEHHARPGVCDAHAEICHGLSNPA